MGYYTYGKDNKINWDRLKRYKLCCFLCLAFIVLVKFLGLIFCDTQDSE